MMTFLAARRRAREIFPSYSRAARARWVWLRLRTDGPRVPVGIADQRTDAWAGAWLRRSGRPAVAIPRRLP